MRKIRFVCVGKTQDPYLITGIDSFQKKLKHFCQPSWVILKEASYKRGNKDLWLAEEAKRFQTNIENNSYQIACDEHGKQLNSTQFADLFQRIANSGFSQIDFLVGGAFGLPQEIIQKSNYTISLSKMTLTHQMVRLFLIEQVYRAFTILKNIKYHHD